MNLTTIANRQFSQPSGILGRVAGFLMHRNNYQLNEWMMDAMDLRPGTRILEIGYGTGYSIFRLGTTLYSGYITGIDHSRLMFRAASRQLNEAELRSQVKLECADIQEVDYPEESFDIICASNVHFFWKNPVKQFMRLREYLREDGKLILAFQPRWIKDADALKEVARQTGQMLRIAGYKKIVTEYEAMKPIDGIRIIALNKW